MLIEDIENIGKRINRFLKQFASCFVSDNARDLLKNNVNGLCSDVSRKNLEAIALHADVPPRQASAVYWIASSTSPRNGPTTAHAAQGITFQKS